MDYQTAEKVTKDLMCSIQLEAGEINCFNPEPYYSKTWVKKITPIVQRFFTANPEFYTEEVVDELTCGENGEMQEKFGKLEHFKELDEILDLYFDGGY